MRIPQYRVGLVCIAALTFAACEQTAPGDPSEPPAARAPINVERSYLERIGTSFDEPGGQPITAVRATEITLPVDGGDSIWGALGVIGRTEIWAGVSGSGSSGGQLLAVTNEQTNAEQRGRVVEQDAPGQPSEANQHHKKIHSRIREADDGFIYFTSMDETGESWRENRLPQFGGRLWRVARGQTTWELVMATPEALIALETVGRYVYALGYWGHVLYQYDTYSGRSERLPIGADCGHVSRNLLVDLREHAYVPMVVRKAGAAGCKAEDMDVKLVEVSPTMTIVAEHELPDFLGGRSAGQSQGITGYTYRLDQSIIFTNMAGNLYHLIAHGRTPALVLQLGNILAAPKSHVTNLVSIDGKSLLGAAVNLRGETKGLHWLVHDTTSKHTDAIPIDLPSDLQPYRAMLLYGSGVRDSLGNAFVGGRIQHQGGKIRPLFLRLRLVR